MSRAALDKINQLIASNAVMVFSKSYCPYCRRAKGALDDLKVAYNALELDMTNDGSDLQAALKELTGQRTVPNIFIHQKHIGGCDDLLAGITNQSVQQLLTSKST
ncbi:hypothetical protein H4R34_005515 [Dimargaris verticillata]|uniref:Glutaredoxin domain-containing protein n=1 Tax=Dimargaris verticillata TaxID=2761393 RepID=A0A9W8B2S7_9FUNG|nr:hypothetical protein H4R34_005515 [Dimargaris verticillata]